MDPNQLIPDPPAGNNLASTPPPATQKPAEAGIVDPKSFLLPKKEVPPPTTERVNAGALLAQEQGATLPPPPPPPPQKPVAPVAPKEVSTVKSLETYQGAIESLVQKNNVSVLSIASAEAARRGGAPLGEEQAAESKLSPVVFRTLLILMSLLLVGGAIAAVAFVVLRPAASVDVARELPAPFINVDETRVFTVPKELLDHNTAINALEEERNKTNLSLGLIARLNLALPADPVSKSLTPLTARELFLMLGPSAPDTLVRALDPQEHLLGVHSFDSNQPFLIFKALSYEQAFSGMLEWEKNMRRDLLPLFLRTPPVRIQSQIVATTSATSTPAVVQTGFVDRIVENHNARVIENNAKDILLLWTFINRDVLVIATNEVTLREIISRLKNAPIEITP